MLLTDKDRLLNDNYTSVVFIHYVGIPLHLFLTKTLHRFSPKNRELTRLIKRINSIDKSS